MRERIAKVQNLLEKNNLDAFLFSYSLTSFTFLALGPAMPMWW